MIIQIRGTSGSGKTTVMKGVMKGLTTKWKPHFIDGRKKPLWYSWKGIYVLGHYESPCGGCDTIGSARQVFGRIQEVKGARVLLCEGLLLSEDVKWSRQLKDLHVVFLTTSLEKCLERIRARRLAAGNDKPLNVKNTSNRVGVIEKARKKLLEEGVTCTKLASRQASCFILKKIKKEMNS